MKPYPIAGPWITQKEIDAVAEATAKAWYGDAGVYNARFEKAFAEHIGTRHAVSLPSCTSAIHLSLAALNIGPGDEVIVPDATWIASSAPISYVGGDGGVRRYRRRGLRCLDSDSFATCITPRTKAVIPVDPCTQRHAGHGRDLRHGEGAWHFRHRGRGRGHRLALPRPARGQFRRTPACSSFHWQQDAHHRRRRRYAGHQPRRPGATRADAARSPCRPAGDRMFYNSEVAYNICK